MFRHWENAIYSNSKQLAGFTVAMMPFSLSSLRMLVEWLSFDCRHSHKSKDVFVNKHG